MNFLTQLDNREIALFASIGFLIILFLLFKKTRKPLVVLVKLLFSGQILTILLFITAYWLVFINLFHQINFWEVELLKVSILWLITVGYYSVISTSQKKLSDQSFKKYIKDIFTLTVLFEFVTSTYVFELKIEFALLTILSFLAIIIAFTETNLKKDGTTKHRSLQKFCHVIIAIISIIVIYHTFVQAIKQPNELFSLIKLKELLIPIALSFVFAPLYWLIQCYARYETLYLSMSFHTTGRKISLKNKFLIILKCRFSINKLNRIENEFLGQKWDQKEITKFLKNTSFKRTTGLYKINGQRINEVSEYPKNSSINGITESFNYNKDQIHTILTHDSDVFEFIGFKIFTKKPVFAQTKSGVNNLQLSQIEEEIEKIDWKFEYRPDEIHNILTEGISNKSLRLNYLREVLFLLPVKENIFTSDEFEIHLTFEDYLLVDFQNYNNLNEASKWLRGINTELYDNMIAEATKFQNSEELAIEEVNKQCDALQSIPQATNNPFIKFHMTEMGNVNFYNLFAAHYLPRIKKSEFIHVNKGRMKQVGKKIIQAGNFLYYFDKNNILVKSKAR